MAAVTPIASSLTSFGFTTPGGPATADTESPPGRLEQCTVAMAFSGTYAQSDGFSVTAAQLHTAIANVKRDGGTIVIWDVSAGASFAIEGSSTKVIAGQCTFTSADGTLTGHLYLHDLSTEHSNAALGAFATPVLFNVTFASTYSV